MSLFAKTATDDDFAERIQKAINDNGWGSWCSLTTLRINQGFTGGNNAILRSALGSAERPNMPASQRHTILRPNAIKALADFMDERPDVGIAGSRLEDPDGTPQQSAFRFPSPLGEFEQVSTLVW